MIFFCMFINFYKCSKVYINTNNKINLLNVFFLNNYRYLGHGSGGRYFGRSSIRESDCKAVSVLMGCSRYS